MLVSMVSKLSNQVNTMDLPISAEQMEAWKIQPTNLVQDVFPHLNADEREFLMSGITPAEWEAAFGSDDE